MACHLIFIFPCLFSCGDHKTAWNRVALVTLYAIGNSEGDWPMEVSMSVSVHLSIRLSVYLSIHC